MPEIPIRPLTLVIFNEVGVGRTFVAPTYFEVDVEQTSSKRPNKASVKIWNLSRASLAWMESQASLAQITATSLMYRGDIRTVRTEVKNEDTITTLTCGDGGKSYASARISRSYAAGTTSTVVLADVTATAGLATVVLGVLPVVPYLMGLSLAGRVRDVLDDILSGLGASWSIQSGVLHILAPGAPATGGALLSPATGLIGSPEIRDDGIAVTTGLRVDLRPHALFSIVSRLVTGWFRVDEARHAASSDGEIWQSVFQAEAP